MYSALKIHYYYRKRKLKMLYIAVAYKISDPNSFLSTKFYFIKVKH